jgi:hypothetical protein
MKDEINQRQLRTVQYQHIDGGFELTFGGSFLLMAICYLVIDRFLVTHPQLYDLLIWSPLLVFGLSSFLIDRLVNRLRMRITYPRTGYLSPSRPRKLNRATRLTIWIGVPVLSVLVLVLLFLNRSRFPAQNPDYVSLLMPAFFGFLLTGLFIIIGWKITLPRFYFIAMVPLLVNVALFLQGVGGWMGMAWLLGATGLSLSLSGGLTLRRYLRQNPIPKDSDEQ